MGFKDSQKVHRDHLEKAFEKAFQHINGAFGCMKFHPKSKIFLQLVNILVFIGIVNLY